MSTAGCRRAFGASRRRIDGIHGMEWMEGLCEVKSDGVASKGVGTGSVADVLLSFDFDGLATEAGPMARRGGRSTGKCTRVDDETQSAGTVDAVAAWSMEECRW